MLYPKITIEQIPTEHHDEIRSVYSSVEYNGGIRDEDHGFLASIDGNPVGAVRLSIEDSVLVLRGMMINPAYQRQGIGTALLQALDPAIGTRRCYCINPPYLKNFYGSIGFAEIETKNAPSFLVERSKSLDREVVIMMRNKTKSII